MAFEGLRLKLHHAVQFDDTEAVIELINQNSRLPLHQLSHSILERLQESLLLLATHCQNEIIREHLIGFLEEFFKSNVKITNLAHHFKTAVESGNVRLIELWLKNGGKPKGSMWNDLDLVAPLVFDRKNITNRKEILKLLLNHGLNARIRNSKGQNFLHKFVGFLEKEDQDASQICEILIRHGASTIDADQRGWKPIHSALAKGVSLHGFFLQNNLTVDDKFLIAEITINAKSSPDINSVNKLGNTILHEGCITTFRQLVIVALQKGADVNLLNNEGKTPFACLKPDEMYYDDCVRIMVKEFAKLNFEKPLVSRVNMDLVRNHEKARNHYEKFTEELQRMANIKFYKPFSYYHVLKMSKSIKKLANLTKNNDFVKKFEENLNEFYFYRNDLRTIFDKAVKIKDDFVTVESRLYGILEDYLPVVVAGKLSKNLMPEDLPL